MAGKKDSKSSKTAHVLNLLSGITSTPDQPQKQLETNSTKPESQALLKNPTVYPSTFQHRESPILQVARSNQEALAETIHQALEQELEQELKEEEANRREEKELEDQIKSEIVKENQTIQKSKMPEGIETDLESKPENSEQKQKEEPSTPISNDFSKEPKETKEKPNDKLQNTKDLPDGAILINVMQILVEESLNHYVELFDLCRCARCLADVQALALTRLPAKYVVLEKKAQDSMMSFYRYRFSSMITVELTMACQEVKKNPHHT